MPLPAHPDLRCGNCGFARDRFETEQLRAQSAKVGHPAGSLQCLRYPNPLAKSDGDVCGEHSELLARRDLALADMIGLSIVNQQRTIAIPIKKGR